MHHLEYYNETNTEHKTLTLQLRSAAMTWQGGNRFVRGVYQAYTISCLVQGDYTRYNLVVVASEFQVVETRRWEDFLYPITCQRDDSVLKTSRAQRAHVLIIVSKHRRGGI